MKYTEILLANTQLRAVQAGMPSRRIAVISNITVAQISEVMEYACRRETIPVELVIGEYDNIVQDAERFSNSDVVCVFLEAANILDGMPYRFEIMSKTEQEAVREKVRDEIDRVLHFLRETPLVLFNQLSALPFSTDSLRQSDFEKFVASTNAYLSEKVDSLQRSNVLLVDINKVLATIGIGNAVDFRYYYSSKALYSIAFYERYADYTVPAIMSLAGRSKKALMLDCDNTLWSGILGEDGVSSIEMTSDTVKGSVFCEVQHIAKRLARRGVIVGLVSKNNPKDIDDLIAGDPRMVLRDDDIVLKKVNWADKGPNLKNAAEKLNIGLDSIVFVDDTTFEVEAVRESLPIVQVEQVPTNLFSYPALVRKIATRFFSLSESAEDKDRARMYRESSARESARESFGSIESYLRSLSLRIQIEVNNSSLVPRIAQLTQKTNQFNLTTIRYTETDVLSSMASGDAAVYTCALSDRFGEYGVVGVCIVKRSEPDVAELDTLLMSCRALGRNAEKAFIGYIIKDCVENRGMKMIVGSYLRTEKNAQVAEFYPAVGFSLIEASADRAVFSLLAKKKVNIIPDYIQVGAT
jgi:FkbH-like protein